MLSFLHLRNFTIVEEVELDLGRGMTVLTGETGAGKSVLIDALGLILGGRAGGDPVRAGAERAELVAGFDISALPAARDWLQQQDLAGDGQECILRRTLTPEGRSKAFINGSPVTLQEMKTVGDFLVDIHGQHAHQSLLRSDMQRAILDGSGDFADLLDTVAGLAGEWQQLRAELDSLGGSRAERDAEIELIGYQVEELRDLDLQPGEFERISEEHFRLGHVERLQAMVAEALNRLSLNEDGSVVGTIESTVSRLQHAAGLDDRLQPLCGRFEGIAIELADAAEELRDYADGLDLDPEHFAALEQRIGLVMQLARKHRVEPPELPELLAQLEQRLSDLRHSDQRVAEIGRRLEAATTAYRAAARSLSAARTRAADSLGRAITESIRQLGIPKGQVEIAVSPVQRDVPARHGIDQIEFLMTANPGQALQPLKKVASGGELSRVSLAIQVVAAGGTGIPTLIFDEVDVGIGGGIAEIVGQQLKRLGRERQVLCITHLAQVASQGDRHLQVSKLHGENDTRTRIHNLSGEHRIEEIARMLGGVDITAQTLAHAREMVARARGS